MMSLKDTVYILYLVHMFLEGVILRNIIFLRRAFNMRWEEDIVGIKGWTNLQVVLFNIGVK